jgi:hypothetical protein
VLTTVGQGSKLKLRHLGGMILSLSEGEKIHFTIDSHRRIAGKVAA